ncbi:MAG TPA: prolyl oligopeptidase family serine peptidase, partial [Gemmatimonadales bacterium]|nr:prolyl oligopeptidase family serine peptidase [Gemmatimonadales bacterium]
IYYGASPDNATQRYLYRSRLDGSGKAERVSPAPQSGFHFYDISPDAHWAFHFYSNTTTVPTTELVKLPSQQVVRVLLDNARLAAAVKPYVHPMEFFKAPLPDGATLDGWMIKPANFDSTKTYPVLLYVYGEPAGQTVLDNWQGNQGLWYGALADQGYIIASVDNRGTPAPRGRAWRKAVYGHFGVLSSQEQADGVRALAQVHKYVDLSRVGVWGWSGGGSSTLNDMVRHGDLFSMGMAVAPVADPSLYDTIYQERYLGTPQDHPDWYRIGTPANFAEGLTGRLLVMHGSGDDNVHYQGTERLLNRLIALDKPVDFMVYPNRTHCICEGRGTTLYVYTTLTRYLLRNLPAGGR